MRHVQSMESIKKDLTRLPSKAKAQMTSGQGSHWLIEIPTSFHLHVSRPPDIFVNPVLNIFTLLAFTKTVDNLIHSFIVLCENEYFLSNLCFSGTILVALLCIRYIQYYTCGLFIAVYRDIISSFSLYYVIFLLMKPIM